MLLGQSPTVSPARVTYEAQRAQDLAARRQASTNARNAAIDKAEDAQTRNAVLRGVLAARGSFAAGDYPQAALNAVSAAVPPIGRGLRVGAALNKGNVPDAIKAGLGFFPKTATPLALFDIGEKLVSGKPEQAALAAGRVVAVAAFGPVFVIGEGIFNFVRKQGRERERYAPASLDEEIRALYERFADVDSAESDRIMLAYADETRQIEQDNARLVRAADAIEGSALPGEFIGEGEPVPVNVLAAVSAISDTGEAGYTPIASLSPDGEIFYDEQFLPIIDEVIDAIVESAAAAEESGEYPAEVFLEGEWQLPVISSLPRIPVSPAGEWRRQTRAEYYSGKRGLYCGEGFSVSAFAFATGDYDPSQWVQHESGEWVSLLECWFVPESKRWQYRTGASIAPSYRPESAPSGPGPSPYTGPSSPGSPYTGPSSPYSGPSSPSSPYSGVQTFPALPASSGGSIVPEAGDPVKRPFPWWIVIATVILS